MTPEEIPVDIQEQPCSNYEHSDGVATDNKPRVISHTLSRKLDRIPLSEKLKGLSSTHPNSYIFRVHKKLREMKEEAYEPEVIAIGPYHCNKKSLQKMEEQKLRYLNSLLQLANENEKLEVFITAIRNLEQQVRNFYDEPLDLTSDELAEMMVLDGCFIMQLLLKYQTGFEHNDPIFKFRWLENNLVRDLMLFENQIPFFVLQELFGMIEIPVKTKLIYLLLEYFSSILPDPFKRWNNNQQHSHGEVKHLLDLIYIYWQPSSFPGADSNEDVNNSKDEITLSCAVELQEAGVKFERKRSDIIFDISFENGTLQIPPFNVDDSTETFLRNILAHEQYYGRIRDTYVANYLHFLDCLIDSTADVELLRRKGIIRNDLGDNEVIAQLFNRILDSITFPYDAFCYAGTFKRVNGYCSKRKNRWMAKLRRSYLHSPWGVISIVAASILLLLTLTQTIFTVYPHD